MRVDLFDFELPEDRIALRPAEPRDAARLLTVGPGGALGDRTVRDLPGLLKAGDVLVLNDTKVIHAELHGERVRDGATAGISVNLIRREGAGSWLALARGAKKLAVGDRIRFGQLSDAACLIAGLDATVAAKGEAGEVTLAFDITGPALDDSIARNRRSAAAAVYRREDAPPTRPTARATRRSTRARRAPSPRRPPGCTSPTISSRGSTKPASAA